MKAAIIGYGKSGAAAEKLLKMKGINTIDIYDGNRALGFKTIEDFTGGYDMTVISPGINCAKYKNLPNKWTSEIELAHEFMSNNAKILAITGTNGKSTTTHLTAQILNNMGIKAVACGNIGVPFADVVLDRSVQVFVIELSSFQIELLNNFRAAGACILNVTPDHLDRYGIIDNYYEAKLRLMKFIDANGLFLCGEDYKIIAKRAAEASRYKFRTAIVDADFNRYPKLVGNVLDFGSFHADLSKFSLFGHHNAINLAFALILASSVRELKGDVTSYIENLTGMPHRTELVGVFNGVRWINDSKGTNVDSVATALYSLKKPSWLLMGGRDKKSDYTVLKDLINSSVTGLCYFGEAAPIIKKQLSGLINVREETFSCLEDAVKFCAAEAGEGATVLLSPGCSSFDEFKNYEDRGEKFASYVHKYAEK